MGSEMCIRDRVLDVGLNMGSSSGSSTSYEAEIGTFRSPDEFAAAAMDLTHPFDEETRLPPTVADTIFYLASTSPARIVEERESQLTYWRSRKDSLASSEQALHARLHAEVAGVVKDKQVLLFKEMLREINYDDLDVVNLLVTGVKIVGDLPRVGIWKPRENPASVSLPALL